MRTLFSFALAVILGFIALPAMSSAEDTLTATEPSTWTRLKVRFDDNGQSIVESRQFQPDALAIEPEPVDWTTFDAAQKVMAAYNVSPFDIVVVQPIVSIKNGIPADSINAVITTTGVDYAYVPSTGAVYAGPRLDS